MDNPNNRMVAAGRLENAPMLSHEVMHEPFTPARCLSSDFPGAVDKIPVTIPGKLLPPEGDPAGKLMLFQGQVRSYNKVVDGAGRLMVTLFVQSMYETSENETLNKVSLTGALCKPPIYRSNALWPRDLRHDAGREPRLWQERLHPLHRLGPQRPVRGALPRGATSCASRGGCNRANIRNSWKTANT